MKLETLTNLITHIPGGTYMRVSYNSIPPLKPAAKAAGWEISKVTVETGRFANYGNLKSVIARRGPADTAAKTNMWYNEIIPNRIVKHKTKDDYYLSYVRDDKSSHIVEKYSLVNYQADKYLMLDNDEDVKKLDLIQDGYWRTYAANEMRMINTNNIINIESKSTKKDGKLS